MAIRKEQSSYNVSLQLKNALISKGLLGEVSVTEVYYSGGTTERHYIDSDMSDGTFRTIVKNGTAIDFDFVDTSDPDLVRMWIKRELNVFLTDIEGISGVTHVLNGNTYTTTITYNDVDYTGSDTKEIDSYVKAVTNLINSANF